MNRPIAGSWTAAFDFLSPGHARTFFRHHAAWISDQTPQIRCDLTAPGPIETFQSLPQRFDCSTEGAVITFNQGPLKVMIHRSKLPWHASASLPAFLDFLDQVRTRVEFPPTGRLLYGLNLVLRALGQAWTAYHDAFLLHASAVADPQGRVHCFSGLSNSGKSTAARQCVSMDHIAEDVVEIRVDHRGRVWAHATPMNTVEKRGGHPFRGPLADIYFVRKAKRIGVDFLEPSESLALLVKNAMMDSIIPSREAAFLRVIARVSEVVPCARLSFPLEALLDSVLEDPHAYLSSRRRNRT